MLVKDIYRLIDTMAPFSSQEEWDNSGLLVGRADQKVDRVLVTLDCTGEAVAHARQTGAQLILSHHPVIFSPLRTLDPSHPAVAAAVGGMAVLCAHTNVDKAEGGLSDWMAEALGLSFPQPLAGEAFGRVCALVPPLTAPQLAQRIRNGLGTTSVNYTDNGRPIRTDCVCSGAGGSLLETAHAAGCDALICGDVKHDRFLLSRELGVALFDCGHYFSEQIFVPHMAAVLRDAFLGLIVEEYDSKAFLTR